MSIEFFQTVMGKRFFESDVPRLVKAIEQIAEVLSARRNQELGEKHSAPEKQSVWLVQYENYNGIEQYDVYSSEKQARADYLGALEESIGYLPEHLKKKAQVLLKEENLNKVQQLLLDYSKFVRVRLIQKELR